MINYIEYLYLDFRSGGNYYKSSVRNLLQKVRAIFIPITSKISNSRLATTIKYLPGGTKRLLSFGMLLAFAVALPLFVFAVTNQTFDIRKRAATVESSLISCNYTINPPKLCPEGYECISTSNLRGADGVCKPIQLTEDMLGKFYYLDDRDPQIKFSVNQWGNESFAGAYGGTFKTTTVNGATASFNFSGELFGIVYTGWYNQGKVTVTVDNNEVGTLDEYTVPTQMQFQQNWVSPQLNNGQHTVILKANITSAKALVRGGVVNLDAVKIYKVPTISTCPSPRPSPTGFCAAKPVLAKNPTTGECCGYGSSCVSPEGWEIFPDLRTCEAPLKCANEGETIAIIPKPTGTNNYLSPSTCCTGLKAINQSTVVGDGSCRAPLPEILICRKCGDGVCGTGENKCNCPEDCKSVCTKGVLTFSVSEPCTTVTSGFRYVTYLCYDNTQNKAGGTTECKSINEWYSAAQKYCDQKPLCNIPAKCVEQCPGTDGVLRNCSAPNGPESDGSSKDSICNANYAGLRIEWCGGKQYCCTTNGWSTTLGSCVPPTPTATP